MPIRFVSVCFLGLVYLYVLALDAQRLKRTNHIAKKNAYFNGVCNLVSMDPCSAETLHQAIDVGEIWGVGRKHSKSSTAWGFIQLWILSISPLMIRDQFSVVMHRTLLEHGIACIELEHTPPAKQIIASRSFGQRIYHIDDLKEAMSLYVMDALAD
jgi:DNA polymerase V